MYMFSERKEYNLDTFVLYFSPFSFAHFIVCPSIYGFWLPLWFLQSILKNILMIFKIDHEDQLYWEKSE